ncbi:MAG: hypothetical protein AAF633_24715, partial [Chloroflexota bacterium]
MTIAPKSFWVMAILLLVLGLGLVPSDSALAQCAAGSLSQFCSASYGLSGGISSVSGTTTTPNADHPSVEKPIFPSAGGLIYADYVQIERQARALLERAMNMRESISPYRDNNDFEAHLTNLDAQAGLDQPYLGNKPGYESATTFAQIVRNMEVDLREARDLYAVLAVFAPEDRFRSDGSYTAELCGTVDKEDPNPQSNREEPMVLPPVIDWCNFEARLRQSVREMANVRMIVGQEFMVDALGVNFSGNFVGGEEMVRNEIAQFRAARFQFEQAEAFLAEGLDIRIGNGCLISDFYTQTEWRLLTQAVNQQNTAQFHIGSRQSYLNIDTVQQIPLAQQQAQSTLRLSAIDAHVKLISMTGLRNPVTGHCQIGERPDGDVVAGMVLSQLETQRQSNEMAAGLN